MEFVFQCNRCHLLVASLYVRPSLENGVVVVLRVCGICCCRDLVVACYDGSDNTSDPRHSLLPGVLSGRVGYISDSLNFQGIATSGAQIRTAYVLGNNSGIQERWVLNFDELEDELEEKWIIRKVHSSFECGIAE